MGPKFTAPDQESFRGDRIAIHRSQSPPVRSESKNSSNPSLEMLGVQSPKLELTCGPRFIGSPKVKSAAAFPPPSTTAVTHPTKTVLILQPFNHFILDLPFCPSIRGLNHNRSSSPMADFQDVFEDSFTKVSIYKHWKISGYCAERWIFFRESE